MHKTMFAGMAAALALTGAAEAQPSHGRELAEGAANLDFIVVNRTGRTVVALAITPSGESAAWSDDILVQSDVPTGERAAASYTRDVELCLWDVRATFEDGRHQSWQRVNLCDTIRVVLR
ncbi:MAG TPA: hypothetical protein VF693_04480 [Allosphingosinicella sp.]|jgi:hypothetical protein